MFVISEKRSGYMRTQSSQISHANTASTTNDIEKKPPININGENIMI